MFIPKFGFFFFFFFSTRLLVFQTAIVLNTPCAPVFRFSQLGLSAGPVLMTEKKFPTFFFSRASQIREGIV